MSIENQEIQMEVQQSTVKEQLYEALQQINPIEQPVEYLDVLDHYEQEALRESQEERREKVFTKLTT